MMMMMESYLKCQTSIWTRDEVVQVRVVVEERAPGNYGFIHDELLLPGSEIRDV